jgi:hypothetical protein
MATFFIGTEKIDLPATQISPTATTEQPSAWLHETHITVHSKTVERFRVHTNGVAYPTGLPFGKRVPPRLASYATGRWVFIGDQAISTSSEIVSMFSLPGPFSHLSKAVSPAACVINVGLCKPFENLFPPTDRSG